MNGPENISKYLSVPLTDRPAQGLLRLTPLKAQQLNLKADQVVRGLAANDGKSIQFVFDSFSERFKADVSRWKGQTLNFRIAVDDDQVLHSRPSASQATIPRVPDARALRADPRVAMTLLANPTFASLGVIAKLQPRSSYAAELSARKALAPQSTLRALRRIGTQDIKKQLQLNGFRGDAAIAEPSEISPRAELLGLMKQLLESAGEGFGGDEILRFTDYLNANSIEYVLRQEENEIGLRFIVLFAGLPPAEIFVLGRNTNPKKPSAHKFSVEVSLTLNPDQEIRCHLELLANRTVSLALTTSDRSLAQRAETEMPTLIGLLGDCDIQVESWRVNHQSPRESDRRDLLRDDGNLDLSV